MASQVDICNLCLSLLGKPNITSLLDNSNAARVLNIEYDLVRRALIEGRPAWRFSVKRGSLPALSAAPVSGPYTTQYALPTDCIRPLLVGDTYPGLDLTDYRMGPTDVDYQIEGRNILCDYGSPLSILYLADVTDTTLFDPQFVFYFGAKLAELACERLTGSDAKKADATARARQALSDAAASNALVKTAEHAADSEWVLCRLQ